MKNKLLYITHQSIPYVKELRPIVGSVTACILWQQLDFHFVKKPDGFYKFLEPCKHQAYKMGDSWIEELGFSVKEFRNAFDKIGIRYSSKNQFDNANYKFRRSNSNETLFCSYHNKINGLTFYFRNHDYVDQLLDNLVKNSNLPMQQTEKSTDAQRASTELPKGNLCNYPKGIYGTAQRESTLITKITTKNTTETHTHGKNKNSHKKNVCVLDELNDNEKAAWKWAQSHDFWKGRITTLKQLKSNLADNKPFRVQFEQTRSAVKPLNGKKVKVNGKRMKAKDCPYCNERGMIEWRNHIRMDILDCPHDPDEIKRLALKKEATIGTAKLGYDDPAGLKKPKITPTEKTRSREKLRQIIGGFQTI